MLGNYIYKVKKKKLQLSPTISYIFIFIQFSEFLFPSIFIP